MTGGGGGGESKKLRARVREGRQDRQREREMYSEDKYMYHLYNIGGTLCCRTKTIQQVIDYNNAVRITYTLYK